MSIRYLTLVLLLNCVQPLSSLFAQHRFIEIDGLVVMEAEHATAIKGWQVVEGASGTALQDTSARNLGYSRTVSVLLKHWIPVPVNLINEYILKRIGWFYERTNQI